MNGFGPHQLFVASELNVLPAELGSFSSCLPANPEMGTHFNSPEKSCDLAQSCDLALFGD